MSFSRSQKSAALAACVFSLGLLASSPAIAETADSILIADGHSGGHSDGDSMDDTMMDDTMMDDTMMDDTMMDDDTTSGNTIVDIASGSDSFSTLVQAVQAAGLVDTLAGPGPYTVFAPTDAAFASLPDGALDFLLQPENKDVLTQVLTYHVVPGEVTSGELSTGGVSALGGGLAIGVFDSGVVVNNASVTQADIQASNGVIHQVNRVLVPSALQQQLSALLGVGSLY